MLQKLFLWISIIFLSNTVFAQPNFQVQGTTPNLYLVHKVQPKETWYSIGRFYNLSPKEIAPFNNTDLSKGLSVGQAVKVPLVAGNFSQDGNKAADEVFLPVYHKVGEGEWMFRVSTNYNKVPVDQLEKWNKISSNQVRAGLNLVVGYLKVKSDQAALAGAAATDVAVSQKPAAVSGQPASSQPAGSQPSKSQTTNNQPVIVQPASTNPGTTNPAQPASIDFKGGFFKSQFESNGKSTKGVATIFRSTSGWNDGKYYALMDNVPVGTIILVSNTVSSKTVYAKVLGNLSDIKENAGLVVRISNSAAAELGAGEGKFSAEIKY